MPPFRPLFSGTNIGQTAFNYSMTIQYRTDSFGSTLGMTVTEIPIFEHPEGALTLPDLPDEYLDVTLIDGQEGHVEDIRESYPLAISDVTTESILDSKKLTNGDNVKEIYSLELSSSFSSFKPGDTIGIVTQNREDEVQRLFSHLEITHLAGRRCKVVEKNPTRKKNQRKPTFLDKVTTLKDLFAHSLDVHCTPKKSLIRVLAEFTKDRTERRKLEELCSREKPESYARNILEGGATFLDFLLSFPSCRPPVARIIEHLPNLLPRPYSIASSPLALPDRVKIVFSVVKTDAGREGLCTGMLKRMATCERHEERKVRMYFRRCNGFNLPETGVPLILVGPGTGIAPFMGFLEHRKMEGGGGPIWLFFGCRSRRGDYIFKEELQQYLDLGVLTKLCVSFSRESHAEARYVQDNIRRYGREITDLVFDQNGTIYVCGDAKNMRKDIQNAFVEAFEKHKGMTTEEATDHVRKLQKDKRYLQDIWL